MISWVKEAVSAVVDEATTWAGAVAEVAIQAVSWVAAAAQTVYYVLFVMTGLEPALEALLGWLSSLLQSPGNTASKLVTSVVLTAAPLSGLVRRMYARYSSPS